MSGEIKVYGIPELVKKLDHPVFAMKPTANFMNRWRLFVEREAKANIKRGEGGWLWKGHDRQSLTSELVMDGDRPVEARAGSNSDTVRFGEYGTGLLSEDPESSHRRYFPPPDKLEPWAQDHGMTGKQVALAIFKRGGIAPRRFLRDAADAAEQRAGEWAGVFAHEAEAEASHGAD